MTYDKLYIGRLFEETFFVQAKNPEEASIVLSDALQSHDVDFEPEDLSWFETLKIEDDVYKASESHLGILEQTGEVEAFRLEVEGRGTFVVFARSKPEVVELMAKWMRATNVPPPLNFKMTDLDEESTWVYRWTGTEQ
jgi:hypothetical protein